MAWTTPRTWVTSELVTAALMNTHVRDNLSYLRSVSAADHFAGSRTFTNASYADLDALTGGAGSLNAVAVTVTTTTQALVVLSGLLAVDTSGSTIRLAYRVSGASTIASNDSRCIRHTTDNVVVPIHSYVELQTGLTGGSNSFELQAKVSANTATLANPHLVVVPL